MSLQTLMAAFRGGTAATTQATNPNVPTPGNIPENAAQQLASLQNNVTAPNGTIPNDANIENKPVSPLDPFADLWKNDSSLTPVQEPLFKISPEQLTAAARTQDFRGSVTKEQLIAIQKGGPDAIEAFAAALNTLGQDVYARSATASTKLIEGALAKNNAQVQSTFSNTIRSQNVGESLLAENPAFSHPAAQTIINSVKEQMLRKYPTATAAELHSMSSKYVQSFADAVAKPAAVMDTKPTGDSTDWSSFL